MAENVLEIATTVFPERRLILFAHDGHVGSYAHYTNGLDRTMGATLHQRLKDRYFRLGTYFYRGEVRARPIVDHQSGPWTAQQVKPPRPGALEELFHQVGLPSFAWDLRPVARHQDLAAWLKGFHPARQIGATYSEDTDVFDYNSEPVNGCFDALVYVDVTHATRRPPL